MLRDALAHRGHQVTIAGAAQEALALTEMTAYDVAIIDYVMPGIRGLDLLHELRKKYPFIRSIIMSAQIDHDVLDAREVEKQLKERVGADRYLPKPVSVDSLVHAIGEVMEGVAGKHVDWKKVASDAVVTRGVKAKDVREMDRTLRKSRKKR
jgi:CheY-like chemotaxis protein